MKVELYQEPSGAVLVLPWFGDISERVQDKLTLRIERLVAKGRGLRAPELESGPDGLWALCVRDRGLAYWLFGFSHGHLRAVLSHGCVEERDLRGDEWEWLAARRAAYRKEPMQRSFLYRTPACDKRDSGEQGLETRDALMILATLFVRPTLAQVSALAEAREEARLARSFAAHRTALGLSRRDVADRLGASIATVRGLEEGDLQGYSLSFLRRAALVLDVRLLTRLDDTPRLMTRGPAQAV